MQGYKGFESISCDHPALKKRASIYFHLCQTIKRERKSQHPLSRHACKHGSFTHDAPWAGVEFEEA
jgi:hypothetical protein